MLFKTYLAVVCMASVASSLLLAPMPKCWRKCAREAGVMCQWSDIPCLCKTANNGLLPKANSCACHSCSEQEFGDDEQASAVLKELSFACQIVRTPLDQGVFEAAYSAATCPSTAEPPHSPPAYGYGPPPPPAPPAPLSAPPSAPVNGYSPPEGPPPRLGPPPPPAPLPPPAQQPHGPVTPPSASVTLPAPPFKPTSALSSKPEGYGHGIGPPDYDSTQIILSTVVIIPVPVSQNSTNGSHPATKTGTGAATITGSTTTATGAKNGTRTGTQLTQATGAANRRDVTGSIFALAAALAFGIA
ncbi:hypothetical protein Vi05172_g13212 [Venturia inaequalis]|nr:hypothetical protein Vi05172_g13212 [Venturia inaequalis]